MAQKVGDIVDIKAGTMTADKVSDPTGDVGMRIGPGNMPADALKKWTVVRFDTGSGALPRTTPYVEIRKVFDIEGEEKDILMSVDNLNDLVKSSNGGKRRTRKGKKSTKKSRKLRKTRGRKY